MRVSTTWFSLPVWSKINNGGVNEGKLAVYGVFLFVLVRAFAFDNCFKSDNCAFFHSLINKKLRCFFILHECIALVTVT